MNDEKNSVGKGWRNKCMEKRLCWTWAGIRDLTICFEIHGKLWEVFQCKSSVISPTLQMGTLRQKPQISCSMSYSKLQKWSGFRVLNLITMKLIDTQIPCLHQCKTWIAKKIGAKQFFQFPGQFLCKADKPLRNWIRFTDKIIDMNIFI